MQVIDVARGVEQVMNKENKVFPTESKRLFNQMSEESASKIAPPKTSICRFFLEDHLQLLLEARSSQERVQGC